MYHYGYRPENLPTLPVSDVNCSLHHLPPPELVACENEKTAMAGSERRGLICRIEKWLNAGKEAGRKGSPAGTRKVTLLLLFLACQALLSPGIAGAGGATWSSRAADVSAAESAARSRYAHSSSMRQIMAPDPQGHQLRQNLRAARDSEMATALGWAFFDGRYFDGAEEWFGLALDWDSKNAAAAEGLVVAAYRSGDVGKAYRYAVRHASLVPYARGVVGSGLERRAQTLMAAGRTREAQRLLQELGRDTRRTSFVRPRLPFGSRGRLAASPAAVLTPPASPAPAATETAEARVKGAIAEGRQFRAQSLARQAGISREQLAAWILDDLSGKIVACQQEGDPRNALRLYSQAIRLGVPSYEARKAGALCLYQMGEYRDAAEALSLLAKEKNDREVEEVLKRSIEQSSAAGGETHLRWKAAGGIGNLIEKCPLVLLLKRISGAMNP